MFGSIQIRGGTANQNIFGRCGICVVSGDAWAAAAVPSPLDDEEYPWYLNIGLLWDEPSQEWTHYAFDTAKTSRLLPDDHRLPFVVENGASGGALNFNVACRTLLELK